MENKDLDYFINQVKNEPNQDALLTLDMPQIYISMLHRSAEKYASYKAEQVISKAIEIIEQYTKENCDDHTPYYGACVTCGSTSNWDIITDIEEMKSDIESILQAPLATENL